MVLCFVRVEKRLETLWGGGARVASFMRWNGNGAFMNIQSMICMMCTCKHFTYLPCSGPCSSAKQQQKSEGSVCG